MATDPPEIGLAADSASETSAALAGAAKAVNDASKAQATIASEVTEAAKSLENVLGLYQKIGTQVILPDLKRYLDGFAKSLIEYGTFRVIDTALEPLRMQLKAVEELGSDTVKVAAIMQGVTGMTADILERAEYGTDNLSFKATTGVTKALSGLADYEIKLLGDGKEMMAKMRQIADPADMLKTFTESALRDSRLFTAATKGVTEDLLVSTTLAAERLHFSMDSINEIFQQELSTTGEISGNLLDDVMNKIIATSRVTGDNILALSKDLNLMMADFTHFGGLMPEQMLSLSNTLHQLGLNVQDVTRLADNFSSFDKATQTVANLAATTGATLDTLELFELAATDPEEFLISLRDQLEAQGVEFENLNKLQQNQIAAGFGIDPKILRRLLNDNIEIVKTSSEAITDEAGKITKKDRETLVASLERPLDTAPQELAKQLTSMENISLKLAKEIETAHKAAAKAASDAVAVAGKDLNAANEKMKLYREGLHKTADEIFKINQEINKIEPPGERNITRSRPTRPGEPMMVGAEGSMVKEPAAPPAPAAPSAKPTAPPATPPAAPAPTVPVPPASIPSQDLEPSKLLETGPVFLSRDDIVLAAKDASEILRMAMSINAPTTAIPATRPQMSPIPEPSAEITTSRETARYVDVIAASLYPSVKSLEQISRDIAGLLTRKTPEDFLLDALKRPPEENKTAEKTKSENKLDLNLNIYFEGSGVKDARAVLEQAATTGITLGDQIVYVNVQSEPSPTSTGIIPSGMP